MLTSADTAYSIAHIRALEAERPAEARLFDDPYAAIFDAAGGHAAEGTRRFLELPFFVDGVRLRTRGIDDFVREGLAAGLEQVVLLGAGFDARGLRAGALFVWEGVIAYIGTEAIARSLRFMARAGGPGSRLVFDFAPMAFDPDPAPERARRAGFTRFEQAGCDVLWRRFLPGEPPPSAFVAHLGMAFIELPA